MFRQLCLSSGREMLSSDSEDDIGLSAASKWWFLAGGSLPNRGFGVHPVNAKRQELGEYHHLFPQLLKDDERFYAYMRMTVETFKYIFDTVQPHLDDRHYSNWHTNPILAEERLVVTIRYLATGNSYKSLSFSFRMGVSTICKIVPQVCKVLWTTLQPIHMPVPTMNDFLNVAEEFERLWGFSNCIGALDGKHCRIKCPVHSGSMYFNYKSYFSIVLQGLVDAHYKFISIDVGGYGKQSDGGTFSASSLSTLLEQNALGIPPNKKLPNSEYIQPHVFIADDAYPLKPNLMKPYPGQSLTATQEIFNKRLSRARKTVECSFGILYSKWRILSGTIETNEKTSDNVIKAICILHNTIIDKEGHHSINPMDLPELPKDSHLQRNRANNASAREAKNVRDIFAQYFVHNPLIF